MPNVPNAQNRPPAGDDHQPEFLIVPIDPPATTRQLTVSLAMWRALRRHSIRHHIEGGPVAVAARILREHFWETDETFRREARAEWHKANPKG